MKGGDGRRDLEGEKGEGRKESQEREGSTEEE